MSQLLNRPFYTNTSTGYRLRQALLFGLFVFLFLLVFEPFRISDTRGSLMALCMGFGALTFFAMMLLNVWLPAAFKHFYAEERWTVGKEIFQTTLNLFVIGLFNFLFFSANVAGGFSPRMFFWFQFSTLAVGLFPLSLYYIFKERRMRLLYQHAAEELSSSLRTEEKNESGSLITLGAPGEKETLTLNAEDIILIRAADNYIDVVYFEGSVKRSTIRCTMKTIEEQTARYSFLFRCHRSYLVNLHKVKRVSGNAQGYKLHLEHTDETVPVSRQLNSELRKRMSFQP